MAKWWYNGMELSNKAPNNTMWGFIYVIEYTNGKKYIGKKQFWSESTTPALKNGEIRPNSTRIQKRKAMDTDDLANRTPAQAKKNVKTKLVPFDIVTKENNWRKYIGSSKLTKGMTVKKKTIIEICSDKINLTYCEQKWLMRKDVLIDDVYLNDCVGGKFYAGKIVKGK